MLVQLLLLFTLGLVLFLLGYFTKGPTLLRIVVLAVGVLLLLLPLLTFLYFLVIFWIA